MSNSFPVGVVFLADTNFIKEKFYDGHKVCSIFPISKGDGAKRFTADEMLNRSKILAVLYSSLVPEFCKAWNKFFNSVDKNSKDILRPIIIYVTSIYVDRLLRVDWRINQNSNSTLYGINIENSIVWNSFDEYHSSNVNWRLNQDVINRILKGMGHVNTIPFFLKHGDAEYPVSYKVDNKLFGERSFFSKINHKINDLISLFAIKILKINFIGTIGLLSNEQAFRKKKFLGISRILCKIPVINLRSNSGKNLVLRQELFNEISPAAEEAFCEALKELRIADHSIPGLVFEWKRMLVDWFPTNLLENLDINYRAINKNLPNSCSAIIGSQLVTEFGLLNCIAAKNRGLKVIGIQHNAGHYGYIRDLSIFANFEYPLYDEFVTYGWSFLDEHLPKVKTISLPSPKLSEDFVKNKSLECCKNITLRKYDILFMPNLFHRFPHASTSGQTRVDFIDEIFNSHTLLIKGLLSCDYRVLHKPYDRKFVDLYPEYYKSLSTNNHKNYSLFKTNQKGLSNDLCSLAKIILWDQLGSGAVECFASGLPTMIYWDRIYSQENDEAASLIKELEDAGLLHKRMDTLLDELAIYFKNPKSWVQCERRAKAIHEFCFRYAKYSTNWHNEWVSYLKQTLIN